MLQKPARLRILKVTMYCYQGWKTVTIEDRETSSTIVGSCHCGSVRFAISEQPQWLTSCNCSVCRRYAALWGHVDISSVTVEAAEDATIAYIRGDGSLAFHSCRTCGCTTHWENLKPQEYSHMAVNFRMCAGEDISRFRIRQFDGADSWAFID